MPVVGDTLLVVQRLVLGVLFLAGQLPFAWRLQGAQSTARAMSEKPKHELVIQAYNDGLAGVRSRNPDVHLSLGKDSSVSEERVLLVDYPEPTKDPAGRDVQCTAEHQDWTGERAISFQIKPNHPVVLSLSFIDRNGVVYTARRDLKGGEWQKVRIPFDEIRPNPFFQPPNAKTGAPLDVSEVKFIAFAPQDQTSGSLAIGKFVVSR